jgi:hypothetical protein
MVGLLADQNITLKDQKSVSIASSTNSDIKNEIKEDIRTDANNPDLNINPVVNLSVMSSYDIDLIHSNKVIDDYSVDANSQSLTNNEFSQVRYGNDLFEEKPIIKSIELSTDRENYSQYPDILGSKVFKKESNLTNLRVRADIISELTNNYSDLQTQVHKI